MATYWENSCSFGLRYVSWYKYLIVSLVFSHLGFWSGNLFLIAPFPDLCLLVLFHLSTSHILGNHITLNQSKLPLSQNHIPLSPVPKPIPVIQLTIPVQNPNFLVKTKDKIPYPSQFVIIVRKLATLFLNVWH